MRNDIIQHALRASADTEASPGVIAEASVRALDSLFSQLEPLVGVQGARALYARSLHVTRAFQWPVQNEISPPPREELLHVVDTHLGALTPQDARRASEALLHAFADLLLSLIGEPLTLRLLRSAWDDPAAEEPPRRTPDE